MGWVLDPQNGDIRKGDGDVEFVITGTAEDFVLMITGEANLGVMLFSREESFEPNGRTLLVTNYDSDQLQAINIHDLP